MGVNMEKWKQFEIDCCEYLNDTYGVDGIEFVHAGFSDSTAPDIIVKKNGVTIFNMEVKMNKAQSGQFVVLPKDGKFEFSKANKSEESLASEMVAYMDNHYDTYANVGQSLLKIDIGEQIYFNWINAQFQSKNIKFVVTIDKAGFVVFPVDKFSEYFEIECGYRRKPSGSNDVPKKWQHDALSYFKEADDEAEIEWNDKKLYIKTTLAVSKGTIYEVGGNRYFVSEVENGRCLIKKLSKTNNPNVIFNIDLRREQDLEDITLFEDAIK